MQPEQAQCRSKFEKKEGKTALWNLIDSAQVFLHAIRPQKITKLGFEAAAVMSRKPGIVYTLRFTDTMKKGPTPVDQLTTMSFKGEAAITGTFIARMEKPALVPSSFVDKNTGLMTANGVLAAIIQNLRTGTGVYLEIGMFEGIVAYNLVEHLVWSNVRTRKGASRLRSCRFPYRRPHPTQDGHICMLPYTDKQWLKFWDIAGRRELA